MSIKFIRSQNQLAIYKGKGKGHIYTYKEAESIFSSELIKKTINEGSALITRDSGLNPSAAIKERRIKLKLSMQDVAYRNGLSKETIERLEDPSKRSNIKDMMKIAFTLGLDSVSLSTKNTVGIGEDVVYSLTNDFKMSSHDKLELTEAASLIKTQYKLFSQATMEKHKELFKAIQRAKKSSNEQKDTFILNEVLSKVSNAITISKLQNISIDAIDICERILGIPVVFTKISKEYVGLVVSIDENTKGLVINTGHKNYSKETEKQIIIQEIVSLLFSSYDSGYNLISRNKKNKAISVFNGKLLDIVSNPAQVKSEIKREVLFSFDFDTNHIIKGFNSKEANEKLKSMAINITSPRQLRRGRFFSELIVNSVEKEFISSSTASLYLGIDENNFKEIYGKLLSRAVPLVSKKIVFEKYIERFSN